MRIRPSLLLWVIGSVLALFAFGAAFHPPDPSTANAVEDETTVALVAAAQPIPHELLVVTLIVNNARNLAGFQATVRFDPTQLHPADVALTDELARSGRDVLRLGPVLREDSVALGAATCPVAQCRELPVDEVARPVQGVYGRVELATFQFMASTPGRYVLQLDDVQLVDPDGHPLATTTTPSLEVVIRNP